MNDQERLTELISWLEGGRLPLEDWECGCGWWNFWRAAFCQLCGAACPDEVPEENS